MEFNHDVAMEYASGRSPRLIDRVLGDEGHLSNAQGAGLVRAVLARSEAGRVRHLVQLHLSRECNRPALAREAARTVLDELAVRVEVHTACAGRTGRDAAPRRRAGRPPQAARWPTRRGVRPAPAQGRLPGV